jgi:hypothetical protein
MRVETGEVRAGEEEAAMRWSDRTAYPFHEASILVNAPQGAGVYALHNETTWVYVGESSDIRAELTQLLRGDVACISLFHHLKFSFETIDVPAARAWRVTEVVHELHPICNRRSG